MKFHSVHEMNEASTQEKPGTEIQDKFLIYIFIKGYERMFIKSAQHTAQHTVEMYDSFLLSPSWTLVRSPNMMVFMVTNIHKH